MVNGFLDEVTSLGLLAFCTLMQVKLMQAIMANAGFVDEPGLYTRRKKMDYKLRYRADVAIDNPDWTIKYSQMDEA